MKYEGLQIKQITQFSLEGESPTLNGKYMFLLQVFFRKNPNREV